MTDLLSRYRWTALWVAYITYVQFVWWTVEQVR